jgi:hypothetical protein
MIGFPNKYLVKYEKFNGRYAYYYSGPSTNFFQIGYNVKDDGTKGTTKLYNSTSKYDPTTRGWYSVAAKSFRGVWTSGFYNSYSTIPYGSISFNIPLYSKDGSTLEAVVSSTRLINSTRFGEESFSSLLSQFQGDNRAKVVYIMDTTYRLVATSLNEVTWDTKTQTLKLAKDSTNLYVAQTASYIATVCSNATNAYSIPINGASSQETVYVNVGKWTDASSSLVLHLVAVSNPLPTATEVPPPTVTSDDDENSKIAADASIAAAVLSAFIFVGGVVLVASGKLNSTPMAGPKSSSL